MKALEVDGSTYSVKLDGLAAGSDYQFRVFAHNEAGTSEAPVELKSPVATKKAVGKFAIWFINNVFEMFDELISVFATSNAQLGGSVVRVLEAQLRGRCSD